MAKWNASLTKLFVSFAVLGIVFNFSFDFFAYQNLKSSSLSGDRVIQSYDVLVRLQSLDREVEKIPGDRDGRGNHRINSITRIEELQNLVLDSGQKSRLSQLADNIDDQGSEERNQSLLEALIDFEDTQLAARVHSDFEENAKIERTLLRALVLDGILLLLLFGFFVLDFRRRRKIEQNMTSSLRNLQEANLSLRNEEIRQQMEVKTTVHDLKNPLGSIRGYAELMSEEVTPQTVQEFSERIRKISETSLALVETLLMRPQGSTKKACDLVLLLEETLLQQQVLAQAKEQKINLDLGLKEAWIDGDELRLHELLSNLLSNAIKYSPLGSVIEARIFNQGTDVVFEVEDQGPGFSDEDIKKAFGYGQRLSARPTQGESSSGLGLFVVQQVAHAHKGSVQIKKGHSGGGLIQVRIPLRSEIPLQNLS